MLLFWRGPRIANLGGPEIHSICWHKQHHTDLDGDIKETNFKQLSMIYQEAMTREKVGPVCVLEAEDETVIVGQISYNQRKDELLEFCGTEHKCLDYFTKVLQDWYIWESYLA